MRASGSGGNVVLDGSRAFLYVVRARGTELGGSVQYIANAFRMLRTFRVIFYRARSFILLFLLLKKQNIRQPSM